MTRTIVTDNRTPEEIAYDSLRDGSAYVKPACPHCACELAPGACFCDGCGARAGQQGGDRIPTPPAAIRAWIDRHFEGEERAIATWIDQQAPVMPDNPSPQLLEIAAFIESHKSDEEIDQIIDILEKVEARYGDDDEGIDPRFDRVVDAVFDLPDAQRDQAICLWEGFLAGIAASE
jgi:uncharacterized Zn finger protein (UPF0148 family)